MDFVIARGVDLQPMAPTLFERRFDHTENENEVIALGTLQVFVTGPISPPEVRGSEICLFDGQCSYKGVFLHPFLGLNPALIQATVSRIIHASELPSNGVYCMVKIDIQPDQPDPVITVATDWLGQYPVYIWRDGGKYLVSNNMSMMKSLLPSATRSLWPAVENLVAGGSFSGTQLEEVARLPFGMILEATERMIYKQRSDHQRDALSYADSLHFARGEIGAHIDAILRATGPNCHFVADITGGSDSRAVLSFLLSARNGREFGARCLTQYPNPDANVAGFLMEHFGLRRALFPVGNVPVEKMIRLSAAIHGGARDSGSVGAPAAFTNVVQFKGSFGEIGGATPGTDYVSLAAQSGAYSHERAVDIFLNRRSMARALDLVTPDAVASVRTNMCCTLSRLEAEGYDREHLISEMYVRTRCRTHFGVSSFIENKARILPDPLANRWLVEARRSLPANMHTKNKVILDLILGNKLPHLAFMPMAGRKWDSTIVPSTLQGEWAQMQIVDFNSPALSHNTGPLYDMLHIPDPDRSSFSALVPSTPRTNRPQHAQGIYIAPYQVLLQYFVDNVEGNDEIWRFFNRGRVIDYINRSPEEFASNGIDTNAMGVVSTAVAWKLGLEINPKVTERRELS